MAFIFRNTYRGFLYSAGSRSANPLTGIAIIVLQFMLLLHTDITILFSVFLLMFIENASLRSIKTIINLFKVILPLIVFLGGITLLFGNLVRAVIVVLRILIGSLSFSLYFALTNPSELSRSLERLKIPGRISIIPALALTVVPGVVRDAESTFDTLVLRGEMEGHIWNWLPKTMAIFMASVLYRSEFLAQSLYIKGFGSGKRSHYQDVPIRRTDLIRVLFWMTAFLIVIYFA